MYTLLLFFIFLFLFLFLMFLCLYLGDIGNKRRAREKVLGHARRLEALNAVAQTVSKTLELDELLHSALATAIEVMGADTGSVFEVDLSASELRLRSYVNVSDGLVDRVLRLPLDDEELERALQWTDPSVSVWEVFGEHNLLLMAEAMQQEQVRSFAVVPFSARDQLHGFISVGACLERQFGPDEIELLQAIGNQISVGLENALLYQDARDKAVRLETLHAIAATCSQSLDLDRLFATVLDKILELTDVDAVLIFSADIAIKRACLRAHRGIGDETAELVRELELSVERDTAEGFIARGQPILGLRQMLSESALSSTMGAVRREGLKSFLTLPFRSRERFRGAVILASRAERHFSPDEIGLLESISNELAVGIENANLYQQVSEKAERLALIAEVTKVIGSSLYIEDVFEGFVAGIKRLVDADRVAINVIEGETKRVFAVSSKVSTELGWGVSSPLAGSATEWLMNHRRPIVEDDLAADTMFESSRILHEEGFKSAIRLPLIARGGVIGSFSVSSRRPHAYCGRERELLEQVTGQLAMAVENMRLYQHTEYLAWTDGLTGLYNRRYLAEQMGRELARAQRLDVPLSLILIDLNELKRVNDHFGHEAGDMLLWELSRIIHESMRRSDIAARWGGDEFLIMAAEADIDGADALARRIVSKVVRFRKKVNDEWVSLGVSIGIASYPAHAESLLDLIRKADEAMYWAKRRGRGSSIARALPDGEQPSPGKDGASIGTSTKMK